MAGRSFAVIGAGAWGTALAALLAANGHAVALYTRRVEFAQALAASRENRRYLPGLRLPPSITPTADPAAVAAVDAFFVAVPSQSLPAALGGLPPPPAVVSCAKGLVAETFKRLTQVIAEVWPQARLAALSGPNLAGEIALGLPAAATVAAEDPALAQAVQRWLNQPRFRVYTSLDLIGVEVAGALKNVIALAAGLCDGLGLGDNAKAGLITRGLAEMVRLGTHLGGRIETFYGLAGLGDLVATCASSRSRNRTAGERFARGATLAELEASHLTVEGIPTVRAVVAYADRHGLALPIAQEVYRVIFAGKDPEVALDDLMTREAKAE